jgi:membrane protein DedA with SNARE-associated domain
MPFDFLATFSSTHIETYFGEYGYLGIYLWFITVDQIAPIPEEITLIIIGYWAASGLMSPVLAGLCAIAAFVTVDTVYFFLAKSGNKLIQRLANPGRNATIAAYRDKLRDHMFKTLLVLAFIPRMRLFAPVFVALLKVPFRRFLIVDVATLSIFTAFNIGVGILFHKSLGAVIARSQTVGTVVFVAAVILSIGLTVYFFAARHRKDGE